MFKGKDLEARLYEGAEDDGKSPRTFGRSVLDQNYPNPFNQGTNIKFNIPERGYVDLSIYDIKGQLVKKLLGEEKQAGSYKVYWDGLNSEGKEVASGIYLYRIQVRDFTQAKKMLVLR